MRIPITMCHGIRVDHEKPLDVERLDQLVAIASEIGFESIDYDDLAGWRAGSLSLPERPIMFDFDHLVKSMRYEVREVLERYGQGQPVYLHPPVRGRLRPRASVGR